MNGPNVVCSACGKEVALFPMESFKPFCDDCMAQIAQFMAEPIVVAHTETVPTEADNV